MAMPPSSLGMSYTATGSAPAVPVGAIALYSGSVRTQHDRAIHIDAGARLQGWKQPHQRTPRVQGGFG